jgi:hypothetical protein
MKYPKPKPLGIIQLSDFTHQYHCGEVIEPISYWVGRKAEVEKISSLCADIEPDPAKRSLLVLGTAIGFEPYLFAATENFAKVIGINRSETVPSPAYAAPTLRMEWCSAPTAADAHRDQITCVVCPYMESGVNLTPAILAINPKLIVYIYDRHGLCGPLTQQAWERDAIRAFEPGSAYRRIVKWAAPAHYCLKPIIEQSYCAYEHPYQNIVELQLRLDTELPPARDFQDGCYPWEAGLEPIDPVWLSTFI